MHSMNQVNNIVTCLIFAQNTFKANRYAEKLKNRKKTLKNSNIEKRIQISFTAQIYLYK